MKHVSLKSLMGFAVASTLLLGASHSIQAQTPAPSSAKGKTEILWLGQAGFRIKRPEGKIIVIDPWITGGPKTPAIYKSDLAALGPVDLAYGRYRHLW
jgi:hypothetical protein